MAGGNSGLRLINNNYVPDGTGRDRLVYYDRGFRGGKECTNQFLAHFNNGPTGPGSLCELRERDRPLMGFNHRAEGYAQVKSLSSPSDKFLTDWRTKSIARTTSEWEQRRRDLRMKQADDERVLLRVRSDPGLDRPKDFPFKRSIGTMHNPCFYPPPPTPSPFDLITPPPPKKFIRDDMERNEYPGFSRTPYGGLWKVNSFTGPG